MEVCLLALLLLTGCNTPVPSKPIDTAILEGTSYMVRATNSDGRFLYRINTNPEISVTQSYNILRHAGAIYAMCMSYMEFPNDRLKDAILRSGSFIKNNTILPIPEDTTILAIWSLAEIIGDNDPPEVKLGGTGLGLIALASIELIQPGFTAMDTLKKLGDFLVYSQKPDGSYFSKYVPSKGGLNDDWTSLYYPGEAALGLMMLHSLDSNPKWRNAAARTIEYLAISREGRSSVPADHWALLASEKLWDLPDGSIPVDRKLILQHTIQICSSIMASQLLHSNNKRLGGFNRDGRVTPTATRCEGLLAAYSILPDEIELKSRLRHRIKEGVHFLLRSQVKDGFFAGGFPYAVQPKYGSDSKTNAFNRRVTEIRIDYVQHAVSALIRYKRLVD